MLTKTYRKRRLTDIIVIIVLVDMSINIFIERLRVNSLVLYLMMISVSAGCFLFFITNLKIMSHLFHTLYFFFNKGSLFRL